MTVPTGWDQDCHVVVKLKDIRRVAKSLDTLAKVGLNASIDHIRDVASPSIAAALQESVLRKLLAGNKLRSVRALFTPEAAGVSPAATGMRGATSESLPMVLHKGISEALRGHLMLHFPDSRTAEAA